MTLKDGVESYDHYLSIITLLELGFGCISIYLTKEVLDDSRLNIYYIFLFLFLVHILNIILFNLSILHISIISITYIVYRLILIITLKKTKIYTYQLLRYIGPYLLFLIFIFLEFTWTINLTISFLLLSGITVAISVKEIRGIEIVCTPEYGIRQLHSLAAQLNTSMDKILILNFLPSGTLALYDIHYRFANIVIMVFYVFKEDYERKLFVTKFKRKFIEENRRDVILSSLPFAALGLLIIYLMQGYYFDYVNYKLDKVLLIGLAFANIVNILFGPVGTELVAFSDFKYLSFILIVSCAIVLVFVLISSTIFSLISGIVMSVFVWNIMLRIRLRRYINV